MKWCIHCKKSIESSSEFCPYCHSKQGMDNKKGASLRPSQVKKTTNTDQTICDFVAQKDIRLQQATSHFNIVTTDQTTFDFIAHKEEIKTDSICEAQKISDDMTLLEFRLPDNVESEKTFDIKQKFETGLQTDQTLCESVSQNIRTDQTLCESASQKDLSNETIIDGVDLSNETIIDGVDLSNETIIDGVDVKSLEDNKASYSPRYENYAGAINAFGFSRVNTEETFYENLYESTDMLVESEPEIKHAIPVSEETFLPIEHEISSNDTTLPSDTRHGLMHTNSKDETLDEIEHSKDETLDEVEHSKDETLDEVEHSKDETLDGDLHTQSKAEKEESFAYLREIGAYKVIEEIGSGGMGRVYKVYNPKLRKLFALKAMHASKNISAIKRKRFLWEARLTAKLNHPNIVTVHDIIEDDGDDYIIMDFIEGSSLASIIKEKRFSIRDSLEIMKKIALAMEYSHRMGIVHRDLKPANIMINSLGEPVIMDFGLAKNLEFTSGMTNQGDLLGTPRYMAPEQAGSYSGQITCQTDVYAMGAILYEMLTGKVAVEGDTPYTIIYNILEKDIISPRFYNPKLSKDLEIICLKAMDKSPKRRYEAKSFASDIQAFLNGEIIHGRSNTFFYKTWRKGVKYRKFIASFFIAFSLLALVALFFLNRHQEQRIRRAIKETNVALTTERKEDVDKAYMVLYTLFSEFPHNQKIKSKLYTIARKKGNIELQNKKFDLSLSSFQLCKSLFPVRTRKDNLLENWNTQIWKKSNTFYEKAKKNIKPKNAKEKIRSLFETGILYEKALDYLPKEYETDINKLKAKQKKIQNSFYRTQEEAGDMALRLENFLISRIAYNRSVRKDLLLKKLEKTKERVKKKHLAIVKEIIEKLDIPKNKRVHDHYVHKLVRIKSKHTVEKLITYIKKASKLKLWQRIVTIEALGKLGDNETIIENKNAGHYLVERIKDLDFKKDIQEAEEIIWALYRLKDKRAKEKIIQLRDRVQDSDFRERTFHAYKGMFCEEKKLNDYWHCYHIGRIKYKEKKYSQAIYYYNKSIQLKSDFYEAYFYKALAYSSLGKLNRALEQYEKSLPFDKARSYEKRASIFEKMRKIKQAIANYTLAIHAGSKNSRVYYRRGLLFRRTGKHKRAAKDFQTYMKLHPKKSFHRKLIRYIEKYK